MQMKQSLRAGTKVPVCLRERKGADACTLEHTRHQQTVHKTVPDNNPRLGGRGLGYSPGPRTNPLEVRGRLALCAIYRPHILTYTPVGLTSPDRGDSLEGGISYLYPGLASCWVFAQH